MLEQVRQRLTSADLERFEVELSLDHDGRHGEIEDGILVEVEDLVTNDHMLIIQTLFLLLQPFVKQEKLGWVFIDGAKYILEGTLDDIRRDYQPDLSFVRAGRIPPDFDWQQDFPFAPDLAVEVVSPGQSNRYFTRRVARYLEAGCQEVWIIHPLKHTLLQYRADDDSPRSYTGAEVVTTPLLPGFSISLIDVFAKPLFGAL